MTVGLLYMSASYHISAGTLCEYKYVRVRVVLHNADISKHGIFKFSLEFKTMLHIKCLIDSPSETQYSSNIQIYVRMSTT